MTVADAEAADFGWIAERTGVVLTTSARGVKVVDSAGRTRGVVAFDDWTPNAVTAHIASDTPIAWRKLLPAALHYVFGLVGLGVLVAQVASSNIRSLAFVEAAGFRRLTSIRDGIRVGVDLVLFEMRRENCGFLTQGWRAA